MTYDKPPLSYEELADILIARDMKADRSELIEKLRSVSYYRLSGYWYPFRMRDVNNPKLKLDTFEPGTEFGVVWQRYQFNHDLRLIVLAAIEPIEIAVRTILAHEHSVNFGPFAYPTDDATLPHAEPERLFQFRQAIVDERDRSRE